MLVGGIDDSFTVRMPASVLFIKVGIAERSALGTAQFAYPQCCAVTEFTNVENGLTVGGPFREAQVFVTFDQVSRLSTVSVEQPYVSVKGHQQSAVSPRNIDSYLRVFRQEVTAWRCSSDEHGCDDRDHPLSRHCKPGYRVHLILPPKN